MPMNKAKELQRRIKDDQETAKKKAIKSYIKKEIKDELFNEFEALLPLILSEIAHRIGETLDIEITKEEVFNIIQQSMNGLRVQMYKNYDHTLTLIETLSERSDREAREATKGKIEKKPHHRPEYFESTTEASNDS